MSIEDGKYKLIPLTQNKFAIVDAEDYERVSHDMTEWPEDLRIRQ